MLSRAAAWRGHKTSVHFTSPAHGPELQIPTVEKTSGGGAGRAWLLMALADSGLGHRGGEGSEQGQAPHRKGRQAHRRAINPSLGVHVIKKKAMSTSLLVKGYFEGQCWVRDRCWPLSFYKFLSQTQSISTLHPHC